MMPAPHKDVGDPLRWASEGMLIVFPEKEGYRIGKVMVAAGNHLRVTNPGLGLDVWRETSECYEYLGPFITVCSCGKAYTRVDYLSLPPPPNGDVTKDPDGDAKADLIYRNCTCNSTMVLPRARVELPPDHPLRP